MNTQNRLWNISNPHQGTEKKVLCVCSAGLLRSPTAARILSKAYGYNTRAVGHNLEYALQPLDEVILKWADEVVYVSEEVYRDAKLRLPEAVNLPKKVIILNIPDIYSYMDPELQDHIIQQYEETIGK